jgi:hypothetical protein
LQKEEKETGSVGGEKWRVGSTRFGTKKIIIRVVIHNCAMLTGLLHSPDKGKQEH